MEGVHLDLILCDLCRLPAALLVCSQQQADLVPSGTESSERATAASEDEPDAKKQKTEDIKLDGAPEAALAAGMESEAPAAIASGA